MVVMLHDADDNDANFDCRIPSREIIPNRERWGGTVLILLSTSFYAVSNVVLRILTDLKIDADWFLCFKEMTGVLCLLPWIVFRLFQGRYRWISKRLLFYIVIASIFCQLIGARLHMLGFAVLGLVIAIPIIQSSTMIGTAYLGQYFLGDLLSQRRKIAMGILVAAVVLLSLGKEAAVAQSSFGRILLAAIGTITAGVAYSIYTIVLRFAARRFWGAEDSVWASFRFSQWVGYDFPISSPKRLYSPMPVTLAMLIVLGVGIITFGSCLYLRTGLEGFTNVPPIAWKLVPITGFCNMTGFFFQVHGLRLTSAVQASLIAVSQILVLSLIGMIFFHEPTNLFVWTGLTLTACGVVLSAKPEGGEKGAEKREQEEKKA